MSVCPKSPNNVSILSPFLPNALDIRWDDPSILTENSDFEILGVNIYRSFDSEYGPFKKLNDVPMASNFFRDQTKIDVIIDEDVSNRFLSRGNNANGSWVFQTVQFPIMKQAFNTEVREADHPNDVQLKINGSVIPVFKVDGHSGQVSLITSSIFNPISEKNELAILPTDSSIVTCTYRYLSNPIYTALNQRIFYRITTVGIDSNNIVVETPIQEIQSFSHHEIERLDWIWREAIRRNRWILEQGGERVKVFLRKYVGIQCSCWDTEKKHPINDCMLCFGTGILGGYDGPFDMILAPDESSKRKNRTEYGYHVEHSWETWTGPSPLLSHRDFIVRQNGDRYSLGAVTVPSSRGMILQQHFSMNMFDSLDIRYKVPIIGTSELSYPQTRFQNEGSNVYPQITEKSLIPDERELRGRTVVWENITY
jgi:hypothetical protein